MLKFTVAQIAKHHNLYGQVDGYMRKFSQVCVKTDSDLAKKLEGVLNSEIAIADPNKCGRVYKPTKSVDQSLEDYETVHPGLIGQPDFSFLPAGLKMARIEEFNRVKREL